MSYSGQDRKLYKNFLEILITVIFVYFIRITLDYTNCSTI